MSMAALLLACLVPQALATSPVPDRPGVARSGYLVAPGSLEMEVGVRWQRGSTVPSLLKYGVARPLEVRVGADMSSLDSGDPGLIIGSKVRLAEGQSHGLALLVESNFPLMESIPWEGTLRGLLEVDSGPVDIRFNTGLDFTGPGDGRAGMVVAGVPLVGSVGTMVTGSMDIFGEVGTRVVSAGFQDWILDAGLRWRLTEILVVDAAAGADMVRRAPFVTVGMTANLGRIGG